jgi:hypothetical protein
MATTDDPLPIFIDASIAARPRVHTPPEPWYYGMIDGLARLVIAACLLLAVAAVVVGAVGASWILGANTDDPLRRLGIAVLTAIVPLIVTVGSLVGTFFVALLSRLAVDVARNLRALRHSR